MALTASAPAALAARVVPMAAVVVAAVGGNCFRKAEAAAEAGSTVSQRRGSRAATAATLAAALVAVGLPLAQATLAETADLAEAAAEAAP